MVSTPERLLSLLDGDSTTTPGIPFGASPLGSPEKLHLLWLYAGLFADAEAADVPTPVPAQPIPLQRWLVRTAYFDQLGQCSVEDFRISVKRGALGNVAPVIKMRVKRDNRHWSRWIAKSLGAQGERYSSIYFGPLGTAHVWQFEFACDDDLDIELQGAEAIIKQIGH